MAFLSVLLGVGVDYFIDYLFFRLVGIGRCLGHSIIGRDLWLIVGVAF